MKRLLLPLACLFFVAGCGGASPTDTFKDALMKGNAGQYAAATKMLAPDTVKWMDSVGVSSKTFWDNISMSGTITKVEVNKEETRGEGSRVYFKIHYSSNKVLESDEELIRDGGVWKVSMQKTLSRANDLVLSAPEP